jgi:hypothetical protein
MNYDFNSLTNNDLRTSLERIDPLFPAGSNLFGRNVLPPALSVIWSSQGEMRGGGGHHPC